MWMTCRRAHDWLFLTKESLARSEQQRLDLRGIMLAGMDESGRVAAALLGKRPEVAGNGIARLDLLHQHRGVDVVHVAEHAVDARQQHVGLQIGQRLVHRRPKRRVARAEHADSVDLQDQAEGRGGEIAVIGRGGVNHDAVQIVALVRLDDHADRGGHARLGQARRTALGRRKAAGRVVPRDDRARRRGRDGRHVRG